MKRSISILLCALMSAFVCAAAAGCDNIFDKREKLALPECVLLDDYVYWEQVAGAEGYVVSVNGEELPEQTDCGYRLDKSVDADVKVKAVAAQDSGEFKDSDFTVSVFRRADPTELTEITDTDIYNLAQNGDSSVTLDTSYNRQRYTVRLSESSRGYFLNFGVAMPTTEFKFIVPPAVGLVRIYTYDSSKRMSFEIEQRTDAVIFEFQGANIVGIDNHDAIYTQSDIELPGVAEVVVRSLFKDMTGFGEERVQIENSVTGGSNTVHGKSADGYSSSGFGLTGENGGKGCCGVRAPRAVFCGEEGFSAYGGRGSDGGNGGEAKKLLGMYINEGGHGGNGGAGGDGISAGAVYVNISSGKPLTAVGGAGGAKGGKGSGMNSLGNNKASDGKTGAAVTGEQIVIQGAVEA